MSEFGVILVRIFPHSDWMLKTTDQSNSEHGRFLGSVSSSCSASDALLPLMIPRGCLMVILLLLKAQWWVTIRGRRRTAYLQNVFYRRVWPTSLTHKFDILAWLSHEFDPREWPTSLTHEFDPRFSPTKKTHEFYPWEWSTRITHKFEPREWPTRITHKNDPPDPRDLAYSRYSQYHFLAYHMRKKRMYYWNNNHATLVKIVWKNSNFN